MASLPTSSAIDHEALLVQCQAQQRRIHQFQVLQRISQELLSEVDVDRLLHNILRAAIEVMEANAGSLILLDAMTEELVFRVVEGGGGARLQGQRMPRQQGIAGWVLDNQQAVIVDDTQQDDRFYAAIGDGVQYQVSSVICVPMTAQGKPVGVLQILNKRTGERFDQADKEMLLSFAAQSAILIRNAQLYQELREERDRLVAVEEDVRKDLVRDLHDGPTQLVAAIMMNIEFIRKLIDRAPERITAELDEISIIAKQAMHQLRTMLFNLRPVILETKGMIPALEAYCARLAETERFAIDLRVSGEIPPLTKKAGSAIFAIVQEAISNTRKHSHAAHVWIDIRCEEDTLYVDICDDGEGFDLSALAARYESRGSLGMINMRERAEMIEGTFSINSEPGKGTTIHLTAPLTPNIP